MFIHSLIEPREIQVFPISPKVTLLVCSNSADSAGVNRVSKFDVFDISLSLKDFTSSDFSVSSLSSVGALSKLKTTYMSSMSDMNIADSFETLNFENLQQ